MLPGGIRDVGQIMRSTRLTSSRSTTPFTRTQPSSLGRRSSRVGRAVPAFFSLCADGRHSPPYVLIENIARLMKPVFCSAKN